MADALPFAQHANSLLETEAPSLLALYGWSVFPMLGQAGLPGW